MIVGCGVDLAKVSRFKKLLNSDGFLEKYFHPGEISYIKSRGASAPQSMAARFAAREAFFKALGTGFMGYSLKDIEIVHSDSGRPQIKPHGKVIDALKKFGDSCNIHLSISHEKEYAVAQVILEA